MAVVVILFMEHLKLIRPANGRGTEKKRENSSFVRCIQLFMLNSYGLARSPISYGHRREKEGKKLNMINFDCSSVEKYVLFSLSVDHVGPSIHYIVMCELQKSQ